MAHGRVDTGRIEYDAFISYSGAHADLAAAVERSLEQLARPWRRRRALNVYRDTTSEGASEDLQGALQQRLDRSRFLILLASPEAASSRWVENELRHWIKTRGGPSGVLIAIVAGDIRWAGKDFDWRATTALPVLLRDSFQKEPLWVDLRSVAHRPPYDARDPVLVEAVAGLAAPIHGVDKE